MSTRIVIEEGNPKPKVGKAEDLMKIGDVAIITSSVEKSYNDRLVLRTNLSNTYIFLDDGQAFNINNAEVKLVSKLKINYNF